MARFYQYSGTSWNTSRKYSGLWLLLLLATLSSDAMGGQLGNPPSGGTMADPDPLGGGSSGSAEDPRHPAPSPMDKDPMETTGPGEGTGDTSPPTVEEKMDTPGPDTDSDGHHDHQEQDRQGPPPDSDQREWINPALRKQEKRRARRQRQKAKKRAAQDDHENEPQEETQPDCPEEAIDLEPLEPVQLEPMPRKASPQPEPLEDAKTMDDLMYNVAVAPAPKEDQGERKVEMAVRLDKDFWKEPKEELPPLTVTIPRAKVSPRPAMEVQPGPSGSRGTEVPAQPRGYVFTVTRRQGTIKTPKSQPVERVQPRVLEEPFKGLTGLLSGGTATVAAYTRHTASAFCYEMKRLYLDMGEWFRYAPKGAMQIYNYTDVLHPYRIGPVFKYSGGEYHSIMAALFSDYLKGIGRSRDLETLKELQTDVALLMSFWKNVENQVDPNPGAEPTTSAARRHRSFFASGWALKCLRTILMIRFTSEGRSAQRLRRTKGSVLFLDFPGAADVPLMPMLTTGTGEPGLIQDQRTPRPGWYGILLMERREIMLHEDKHYGGPHGFRAAAREALDAGRQMPTRAPAFEEPVETYSTMPTGLFPTAPTRPSRAPKQPSGSSEGDSEEDPADTEESAT